MIVVDQPLVEKSFVQNPYIFYRQIQKAGGVCFWKNYDQKAFFNFDTINKVFKDKRFGRELPQGLEKPDEKTTIFPKKSTQYRVKKLSQTKYAIEITKITSPGGLFRSTGRFLANFGAPRASQNDVKWTAPFYKNHFRSLREPLWDNFGSPIPFFLHSGSIFESF